MQELSNLSLLGARDVDESTVRQSLWKECKQGSQIFYCQRWNTFIINNYEYIYIMDRDTTKVDLHIKCSIESLTYNEDMRVLCFTMLDGHVIVYWIKSHVQHVIKPSKEKNSPILYFDWLYSMKGTVDFFILETIGLRFFRYDEQKKILKQTKQISIKVTSCWFEPKNQVLACCNYAEGGSIHIFHFNDKRSKNNYKGVSLVLDFEDTQTKEVKPQGPVDFLIKRSKAANRNQNKFRAQTSNKNRHIFHKPNSQLFHIQLVQLYDKTTLLFYNVTEGKLKIYTLLQDQIVKVNVSIKLPSDSLVSFCVYDNLLLAHLKHDRISFVFDIKRNTSQTVVTPMPIKCQNAQPQVIYESVFLDKWLIHPQKVIRKWTLNLEAVFNFLIQEADVFLFLVRRKNSKMILLKWLRDRLFTCKVNTLSSFWKCLLDEYTQALREKSEQRKLRSIGPSDLYGNIFYTLQQKIQEQNKGKFTDIMMECIRQILEFRLQVPLPFQTLLLKYLLQGKKYLILYQLIQLRVLDDTRELALALLNECSKKVEGSDILQQVAIDILYRKKQTALKDLLEIFARQGQVSQIAKIARKYGPKLDYQLLISMVKVVAKDSRTSFQRFIRQFMSEFHPTVKQQFIAKSLANYADQLS